MSYTKIPTKLLSDVYDVITWIDEESSRSDAYGWSVEIKEGGGDPVDPETYDFVVRFTQDALTRMGPLLRWLGYIAAEWTTDDTVGVIDLIGGARKQTNSSDGWAV